MRYILLIILNLPIILLAITNTITKYKLKIITKGRFRSQMLLWAIILTVVIGAFPVYNTFQGNSALDSSELSLFDIAEITVIVALIYALASLRAQVDRNSKRLKDLHQELSIRLSVEENDNKKEAR